MDPAPVQRGLEPDDGIPVASVYPASVNGAFVIAPGPDGFPLVFIYLTVLPASKGLGNSQVWKTPVLTGSPSTLPDHLRNLWQVLQFLIFSCPAATARSSAGRTR